MGKVVILEGPDGSGKTTAARWLEKEKGYEYRHEGPPEKGIDLFKDYSVKLLAALDGARDIVFDRFHLGEMVYGPVKRDMARLDYTHLRIFLRSIKSEPIFCVIFLPSFKTCYANWETTFTAGQDYLKDPVKFTDVYWRYKAMTAYHPEFNYEEMDWTSFYEDWEGRITRDTASV